MARLFEDQPSGGLGFSSEVSPLARIGLALEAFGSGGQGKDPLFLKLQQQDLLERKRKQDELKDTFDTTSKISEMAKDLPPEQRVKFIESATKQFPKLDREMIDLASQRPDFVGSIPAFAQNDPVLKTLIAKGDSKGVTDYLKSETGRKGMNQAAVAQFVPEFQKKLPQMIETYKQNNPKEYEKIIADGEITMPELRQIHEGLPLQYQASKEAFATVTAPENQDTLVNMFGDEVKIIPDKVAGERLKPTALDQRVRLLKNSGATDNIAEGIASGRYVVSVDPQTGERAVVDLVGKIVGGPESIPKIDPENIDPFLPKGIDASQIVGFSGFFKNIVNKLSDSVGLGLTNPDAEEAKQGLDDLQVLTMSLLQAEVPGRPSNFLLQRLERLTVTSASILQGEESARRRLGQTKRLIDQGIVRIDQEMKKPNRPVTLQSMRINQGQLKGLSKAYTTVVDGFGKGGKKGAELDKSINEMSMTDIDKLNLKGLSDEQLSDVRKRLTNLRNK